MFYCFGMFVSKYFTYLSVDISESKRCYNVISSVHYFYIKTNMLADFQICISVPLSHPKFQHISYSYSTVSSSPFDSRLVLGFWITLRRKISLRGWLRINLSLLIYRYGLFGRRSRRSLQSKSSHSRLHLSVIRNTWL